MTTTAAGRPRGRALPPPDASDDDPHGPGILELRSCLVDDPHGAHGWLVAGGAFTCVGVPRPRFPAGTVDPADVDALAADVGKLAGQLEDVDAKLDAATDALAGALGELIHAVILAARGA